MACCSSPPAGHKSNPNIILVPTDAMAGSDRFLTTAGSSPADCSLAHHDCQNFLSTWTSEDDKRCARRPSAARRLHCGHTGSLMSTVHDVLYTLMSTVHVVYNYTQTRPSVKIPTCHASRRRCLNARTLIRFAAPRPLEHHAPTPQWAASAEQRQQSLG